MKRVICIFVMCMLAINMWAQMSDEQIVEYVKKQNEAGMSQQQIAQNLLKRGVTRQQIENLRAKYLSNHENSASDLSSNDNDDRSRRNNAESIDIDVDAYYAGNQAETGKPRIFGHDIFRSKSLSFEPNMNIATPSTYVLGPGDEVIIDIYGASQVSSKLKVSPEGAITVPKIGPIYVSGMTVEQAQAKVRQTVGSHYQSSSIKLTIGQTRTVTINVLGEVQTPGTYSLSAFSTVFNALYMAGGISDIGTLRNIKVVRNGHTITTVDVYDFIMNGKLTGNIALHDNDAIIVGAYDALVSIDGAIKRPMYYEMKSGESLKSLLSYAGGFTGDANKSIVRVERKTSEGYAVHSVDEWDFTSFGMQDGDSVVIDKVVKRYKNMVEINGAVFYPGRYSITNECNSVKGLISKAGGLTETAIDSRAVLYRMQENRSREIKSIDLKNILNGNAPDVILENEDSIVIASHEEELSRKKYYIFGPVEREGEFQFADGMTLEDAIIAAGGLKEEALLSNVEISRRLQYTDQRDTTYNQKAELYTFDIVDGLVINNGKSFIIKPFDVITIKINPEYTVFEIVYVGGEVKYPGIYGLQSKTDRLSDLIKRAGGITNGGDIEGASLTREMTAEEKERAEQLWEMSHLRDTINSKMVSIKEKYLVGIDLEKAIKYPGSTEDVILRSNDNIVIPKINNTVKINGEVLYPNTIAYVKGKSGSYYINQAGGVNSNGYKRQAYVIYANGQVSRLSKGKIMPGCEIVVPSKPKKTENNQKISVLLAIASTIATVGAVLITALK